MTRSRAVAASAVVLAAVVFYAPTVHDYFLQDDFGVVGLLSQKPALFFPRWFVMPWTENIWGAPADEIRPFPALSYQIAAAFGPAAPEPNHVINIAMHAANGLLVLAIAQAAGGLGVAAATFAALVFIVLPIQAESVAWVTGRVDSLPALLYFASFLLFVRWRSTGGRSKYLWSVALFFAALFSKQNTITMTVALVLYDGCVGRRRLEVSWRAVRPYVPYVVLTAGYLLLRYLLFDEVARENTLTSLRFQQFVSDSSRHLARLVFGGPGVRPWTPRDTGIVSAAAVVFALIAARARHLAAPARWRPGIYFAVCWVALGVAPILVSGYYSPRHVYLASLGWAVALGIAFEIVWTARPARYLRPAAVVGALALLVGYSVQLREVVHGWHVRAIVSRQALSDVEREAVASPEGSLLIVGVPTASWGFAAPHAFRPPFTRSDLTRRVWIVSDSSLHCCAAAQWDGYTRAALDAWRSAPTRHPAVAMSWDSKTARLSRVSDVDDPQLDTLIALLAKTDSRETLDSAIRGLLKNFVAVR